MENILIVDTETTGIEPEKGHKVIEIAAILYNVPRKTILQQLSTLIPLPEGKDNDAYSVNKIDADATRILMPHGDILRTIEQAASRCDAIVAHNAEFDSKWLKTLYYENQMINKWICSASDFTWPGMRGTRRLIDIALSLGITVVSAHRALTDCQLLAECFTRLEDLPRRLQMASKGKDTYVAMVDFDNRQLAASAGFVWDRLVSKKWACRLSEEELDGFPFKIIKV